MTEAKDTVTKTTEENIYNTLEERLLEQAEISFRAGRREVVEWIHKCGVPLLLNGEIWQSKLKEWGIEEGTAK